MFSAQKNMIKLQLITRGVLHQNILNAFASVPKEQFISKIYAKQAYIDMELPSLQDNKSILRPFVLAKIAEITISQNHKNILIIGDLSGYTSAIFSHIFQYCSVCVIDQKDSSNVKKNIYPNIKLFFINDILNNQQYKFDVIFFDSGFYKQSFIKKILTTNISSEGKIIFLDREQTINISKQKFHFIQTTITEISQQHIVKKFSTNLFLSAHNII